MQIPHAQPSPLIPERRAFPFDYFAVAHMVDDWVPEWRTIGFDGIVAIARGGLTAGIMASTALAVPLYSVSYHRPTREVRWFTASSPPPGSRLLLIDDLAGSGATLSDSYDFLKPDFHVETCTLVSDGLSRLSPRWSNRLPDGLRPWFPWERESITPAFDRTHNLPTHPDYFYSSWAVDLDGVLLPDLPDSDYQRDLEATLSRRDALPPSPLLPCIDLAKVTVITGRPEIDRPRTRAWLDKHGFYGELVMRDPDRFPVEQTAEFKAHSLHERRHTHFLESCSRQAILIAKTAPVAKIFWWAGDGSVHLVKAASADLSHS